MKKEFFPSSRFLQFLLKTISNDERLSIGNWKTHFFLFYLFFSILSFFSVSLSFFRSFFLSVSLFVPLSFVRSFFSVSLSFLSLFLFYLSFFRFPPCLDFSPSFPIIYSSSQPFAFIPIPFFSGLSVCLFIPIRFYFLFRVCLSVCLFIPIRFYFLFLV